MSIKLAIIQQFKDNKNGVMKKWIDPRYVSRDNGKSDTHKLRQKCFFNTRASSGQVTGYIRNERKKTLASRNTRKRVRYKAK